MAFRKGAPSPDQNGSASCAAREHVPQPHICLPGDTLVSMVVGIFPNVGSLKPVVDGLASMGADLARIRVLSCDEVPTELASTGIEFVWIGDVERGVDQSIITGSGGTSIPGITSRAITVVEG